MSTALDKLFDHYLDAVLRNVRLTARDGNYIGEVTWAGEVLISQAITPAATIARLRDELSTRIFAHMRAGAPTPIISGISLNGGSC